MIINVEMETNVLGFLTFLSISTIMIITDKEQGVHLIEDRTHTYAQYRHFSIFYGIRLAFLDSNGHQLTN